MDFDGDTMEPNINVVVIVTEDDHLFVFDDVVKIISPLNKSDAQILKLFRKNRGIFVIDLKWVKRYSITPLASKS